MIGYLDFLKSTVNDIELCLEQEPKSRALKCIEKYGTVKEETDGCIYHCILDRDRSSCRFSYSIWSVSLSASFI